MAGVPANASTRRTCSRASPVRRSSCRATSAGARRRRHSMMRRSAGPWASSEPPSGSRRRKRYWMCCSAWVATKVPLPWRRTSRLSVASSSMALRTVPWLTRNRAARSNSLGIMSPGFHSPACRLRRISDLICWYSGLKAGAPSRGPAPASGCTVWAGSAPGEASVAGLVAGRACGVAMGWGAVRSLKACGEGVNHILYKT